MGSGRLCILSRINGYAGGGCSRYEVRRAGREWPECKQRFLAPLSLQEKHDGKYVTKKSTISITEGGVKWVVYVYEDGTKSGIIRETSVE